MKILSRDDCALLILAKLRKQGVSSDVFQRIDEVGGVFKVDWEKVPLPSEVARYVYGILFLYELQQDLNEI